MKIETILGAILAAVIAFGGGALALLQQEGVEQIADISQIAWVVLAIAAGLALAKDLQALTVRRSLTAVTGSGNVHSPRLVGILAIVIACMAMSGCAGTRAAYKQAEGLVETSKVVGEHYYVLVREANALAEEGTLVGRPLQQAQAIVRSTRPLIVDVLAPASDNYERVKSAANQAELERALSEAAIAVSRMIDVIRRRGSTAVIDEISDDLSRIMEFLPDDRLGQLEEAA